MDFKPIVSNVVTSYVIVATMGIEQDIKQSKFKTEYNKLIVNVFFTNNWLTWHNQRILKPFGLTIQQYNVLRILRGQYPNPATVNMIIERMMDRMSNASRIVDKLESKGLVLRQQCKDDRRAVDVIISEAGLQMLSDLDKNMREFELSLNSTLPEADAQQLNLLLDKLRSSLPFE